MSRISLKMVRRLSAIFAALGFLLLITGICIGAAAGLIVLALGLVVLLAMLIFIALFSRCPRCGGFLKIGFANYYCPHCGRYINYNAD